MNIYLEIYILIVAAFYTVFSVAFVYEFCWLSRRRVRPVDIVTLVLFPPLWPIGAVCFLFDLMEVFFELVSVGAGRISSFIKKFFFQKIFKLISKMFKLEQKRWS